MHFYIPYGISELNQVSFGSRIPNKHATIGIGLLKTGTALLNSQSLFISLGRKLNSFSYGFSTEIRQVEVNENGNHTSVLFNLGASSSIIPKIEFSMFISNINQAGIGIEKKEIFPSQIKIASKFLTSEKLFFYGETDLQLGQRAIIRVGLEYIVLDNLTFYTGLKTKPLCPSFGFSIKKRSWSYCQSIDYDQNLGFSHGLSISYEMAGRK